MKGIIDIVVNLFTPQEVEKKQTGLDEDFKEQVRMPKEMGPVIAGIPVRSRSTSPWDLDGQ